MSTVASSGARCQGNSAAPAVDAPDNELVRLRQILRDACEESDTKKESIASAMGLPDAAYLSKLFSGEKPLTARHLASLPVNVRRIFARRHARAAGLICFEPIGHDEAVEHFVIGCVALFSSPLPTRAERMAKASLR